MHWADVFVNQLSGDQVISTGISPSGPIHVGNMREILTGDITHKAAILRGLKSRFIYLCDDMDPLRKKYPYLPDEYENYVGKPLYQIPAPSGSTTYSEYFLAPFLDTLDKIDVQVEVIRSHSLYEDGTLADMTRIAIEKREKIRSILEEMSGRELSEGWYPYNPLCSKCGKINQATVTGFSYPFVSYTCKCGNQDRSDIRKAQGKMPWRVEWPAKWFALGVTVESFGKDHAAAGSSYDTGKLIIEEVFGRDAPKGIVYEHIFLKGKGAMHSSTGITIAASDMIKFSPPEIIRFMIARNNPSRHIDFDPAMGLLNLIDEFDKYKMSYYGKDEVSDEDYKRVYELSRIKALESLSEISFRHLVTLIQIYPDEKNLLSALNRSGYESNELDTVMRMRVDEAKTWISLYAPEQVKFSLLNFDNPVQISDAESNLLADFLADCDSIEWNAETIHSLVHDLIKKNNFEQGSGFKAFYRVLIGKERGPRLGYFLSNMDRETVKKRLSYCVENH